MDVSHLSCSVTHKARGVFVALLSKNKTQWLIQLIHWQSFRSNGRVSTGALKIVKRSKRWIILTATDIESSGGGSLFTQLGQKLILKERASERKANEWHANKEFSTKNKRQTTRPVGSKITKATGIKWQKVGGQSSLLHGHGHQRQEPLVKSGPQGES